MDEEEVRRTAREVLRLAEDSNGAWWEDCDVTKPAKDVLLLLLRLKEARKAIQERDTEIERLHQEIDDLRALTGA